MQVVDAMNNVFFVYKTYKEEISYHTFIELLVCYILCLVRTKVVSDFPFQLFDQNE